MEVNRQNKPKQKPGRKKLTDHQMRRLVHADTVLRHILDRLDHWPDDVALSTIQKNKQILDRLYRSLMVGFFYIYKEHSDMLSRIDEAMELLKDRLRARGVLKP